MTESNTTQSKPTRVPKVGTLWIWEVGSPYGRTLIEVVEAFWNGEEWWVRVKSLPVNVPIAERGAEVMDAQAPVYPNELERFWEAVVPVNGAVEDLTEMRPDA